MTALLSLITTELDGLIERERRDERIRTLRDVAVALTFEASRFLDESHPYWMNAAVSLRDDVLLSLAALGDPDAIRMVGGGR